jgi:hypothetical protein
MMQLYVHEQPHVLANFPAALLATTLSTHTAYALLILAALAWPAVGSDRSPAGSSRRAGTQRHSSHRGAAAGQRQGICGLRCLRCNKELLCRRQGHVGRYARKWCSSAGSILQAAATRGVGLCSCAGDVDVPDACCRISMQMGEEFKGGFLQAAVSCNSGATALQGMQTCQMPALG